MKTIIAIPENKTEWKEAWTKNKKKIVGAAVAAGAFIAGAVMSHGKLWGNDDSAFDDEDQTAGYIPEDCGDDEDHVGDPDEENEEETEENEADAE